MLWASAGHAGEEPKRGGSAIVVIGADPAILNPNVTAGVPDVLTGCMLYDGLVRFAEGFRIVPSLAKRWEIGADGLTYTFHLVTANWSDGQPLTSDDVKYTLLEVSSKYGSKFAAPGKAIKDIKTPDAQTVVVTLSKPFGPFLFSLACEQNAAILPAPSNLLEAQFSMQYGLAVAAVSGRATLDQFQPQRSGEPRSRA